MIQKKQRNTLFFILFFTIVYALFINSHATSANDESRLGAIESLVKRGTWQIDESPFVTSVDKIQVDGKFYSDKPPSMAFIGAGIFAVLHYGFGLEFQPQGCTHNLDFSGCLAWENPATADWAYYILTLVLVVLPAVALLALLFHLTQKKEWPTWLGIVFVGSLGLGTALWPYSTVFTNHAPATAAICFALYILLYKDGPKQLFLAGFLATLAATLDLSITIYLLAITIYVLGYRRNTFIYFVGGALIPGILAIVLNYSIVGNLFPPQMFAEGYNFAGSPFISSVAGNETADSPLTYAFDMLFGVRGLFSFSPVAILFAYGFIHMLKTKEDGREPKLGWAIAIATIGYLCYFIFFTDNFGGKAFGTRWLLTPLPILALFAISSTLFQKAKYHGLIAGAVILLAIPSIWSSYYGALAPWQRHTPLIRAEITAPSGRQPISLATSGYGRTDELDPILLDAFGTNPIIWRQFDAQQGFVIPEGNAWWAINTPTADVFTELFGAHTNPSNIYTNFTPTIGQTIQERFAQIAYQDPELTPQSNPAETHELPILFRDVNSALSLDGILLTQTAEQVAITTAWQIQTQPAPSEQRRIFIHLLNQNGEIVAQSDLFAAVYDSLHTNDYFFQQQILDTANLPAGTYWAQLGVYDPQTGARLLTQDQNRILIQSIEIER